MKKLESIKKLQNYIMQLEPSKRHFISKISENNPNVPKKDLNQYILHLARKNTIVLYELEDHLQMTQEIQDSAIDFGGVLNHIIYTK